MTAGTVWTNLEGAPGQTESPFMHCAIVGDGCAGDAEDFHLFRPQQAFGRVSLAGRFRGPFTGMLRARVHADNTIAENALSP